MTVRDVPRAVLGDPAPVDVPRGGRSPRAFHRALPGYAPTPLRDAPALARALGLSRLLVKDESERFGLPAFKYLGASWAAARLVAGESGCDPDDGLQALARAARGCGIERLCAASEGNHGRAVARVARQLGLAATVVVPRGTADARCRAIAAEEAEVVVSPGGYDDAVREAAALGREPGVRVIADADLEGGSPVPAWVVDGYSTLFDEAAEQCAAAAAVPGLVVLQIGVGAFAAAGVRFAVARGAQAIGVEPAAAACVAASLAAGAPLTVESEPTLLAGLDCATPSRAAWPTLAAGLRGVVAIDDREAEAAARDLADCGIHAGLAGAAGLAGLRALCGDTRCAGLAAACGVDAGACALVVVTEGAGGAA